MGKRNQRRNYTEESSAPKRRKTGEESYTCSRMAIGDVEKTSNVKRKEIDVSLFSTNLPTLLAHIPNDNKTDQHS